MSPHCMVFRFNVGCGPIHTIDHPNYLIYDITARICILFKRSCFES